MRSSDNHMTTISRKTPQSSIFNLSLKITYLNGHSNLSGANELTWEHPGSFDPADVTYFDVAIDRDL